MQKKTTIVFVSVLLLVFSSLSTPTSANPMAPENVGSIALNASYTVTPVADAHVNSAYPSTNYGTATELRVDGSPAKRAYLRFTAAGLSGAVTQATLRLYVNTSLSAGIKVLRVADNNWGETTINYSNAPAVGTAIATMGAASSGAWISVDVTSYVTGNGTFSLLLASADATALRVASREAANKPELVITTAASLTPTATSFPPTATKVSPTATMVPPTATKLPPTATMVPPTATKLPPTATPPSTSGSVAVNPVADAHVNSAYPSTNYGAAALLNADGSPVKRGYLRFNVAGLTGAVSKATLRLYATSSLSTGIKVIRVADNSWGETTINFSNAPAVGTAIATSGAATTGSWFAVDVTSYVTGNGTFSFALTNPNSTALTIASREASDKPQLVVQTGSAPLPTSTKVPATATPVGPTATKVPPTATPSTSGNVRVLCDGKVYDGYASRPFQLESPTDKDPNILKIIRNCVFRNSKEAAIVIRDAKNVLIEGNTFENIRTHVTGDGVHAINIACEAGCAIDNITIRNNSFKAIGADGIQLGQNTRNIRHVYIQNNEFVGGADVGENAVDVKGVEGPIYITGNKVHGFRPCESPKTKVPGTQDCSGSPGEGIVIHDGGAGLTSAYNVTVENNDIYDNTLGLVISEATRNIVARGNRVYNNLKTGILVSGAYSVIATGNILSHNPTHISVSNTPLSGGSCNISGNTFVGGGTAMSGGCN